MPKKMKNKAIKINFPIYFDIKKIDENQLSVLVTSAEELAESPYSSSDGSLPTTLWRDARIVAIKARSCLQLLKSNKSDCVSVMQAGLDLGLSIGQVNTGMAVWICLRQKQGEVQKHADAASAKNAEVRKKVIEEWIKGLPRKRGEKAVFANKKSEELKEQLGLSISSKTIRQVWLSPRSIFNNPAL